MLSRVHSEIVFVINNTALPRHFLERYKNITIFISIAGILFLTKIATDVCLIADIGKTRNTVPQYIFRHINVDGE